MQAKKLLFILTILLFKAPQLIRAHALSILANAHTGFMFGTTERRPYGQHSRCILRSPWCRCAPSLSICLGMRDWMVERFPRKHCDAQLLHSAACRTLVAPTCKPSIGMSWLKFHWCYWLVRLRSTNAKM